MDEHGNPTSIIYYMGVIDILTVYNWKKKGENFLKSIKYSEADISAVNPKKYAARFVQFMKDGMR